MENLSEASVYTESTVKARPGLMVRGGTVVVEAHVERRPPVPEMIPNDGMYAPLGVDPPDDRTLSERPDIWRETLRQLPLGRRFEEFRQY